MPGQKLPGTGGVDEERQISRLGNGRVECPLEAKVSGILEPSVVRHQRTSHLDERGQVSGTALGIISFQRVLRGAVVT